MPAYAGFESLTAYIDQRCAEHHITRTRLSTALGKNINYIYSICDGTTRRGKKRRPAHHASAEMCDRIAEFFGDKPHIVRVLAGREDVPPDSEARALADKVARLSPKKREMVIAFVEFVAGRK